MSRLARKGRGRRLSTQRPTWWLRGNHVITRPVRRNRVVLPPDESQVISPRGPKTPNGPPFLPTLLTYLGSSATGLDRYGFFGRPASQRSGRDDTWWARGRGRASGCARGALSRIIQAPRPRSIRREPRLGLKGRPPPPARAQTADVEAMLDGFLRRPTSSSSRGPKTRYPEPGPQATGETANPGERPVPRSEPAIGRRFSSLQPRCEGSLRLAGRQLSRTQPAEPSRPRKRSEGRKRCTAPPRRTDDRRPGNTKCERRVPIVRPLRLELKPAVSSPLCVPADDCRSKKPPPHAPSP